MNYRRLGETNIIVSEIGFGAWGIGGVTPGPTSYGPTDDIVSLNSLKRAFEKGIYAPHQFITRCFKIFLLTNDFCIFFN